MLDPSGLEEFSDDARRLSAALARYGEFARQEIGGKMRQALLLLAGRAAVYPSPPGGSTYRRMGTLGRLWRGGRPVVNFGGGGASVEGTISNATPYGPFVQSPAEQAYMHRGRWQTTEDVIRDSVGDVDALVSEAVDAILARIAAAAR